MRNTILEQLCFEQKSLLSTLIKKTTADFNVDQIICYGHKIKNYSACACHELASSNSTSSSAVLYLLIVTAKEEHRSSHDIIQAVENYSTPALSTSCIVHHSQFVSTAIIEGHPFFSELHQNGCLLFGNKQDSLPMQTKAFSLQERLDLAELTWNLVFAKAQGFLTGAAYAADRSLPELTTFLLHQAVEQTAMALLRSLIGYRHDSHNLSRLLPLMEYTGLSIDTIFPQNTQEEKELFHILKRSYSETRYKDDFHVDNIMSEILYNRTEELMNKAEAIFLHETNRWREQLENHSTHPLNVAFINPLCQAS